MNKFLWRDVFPVIQLLGAAALRSCRRYEILLRASEGLAGRDVNQVGEGGGGGEERRRVWLSYRDVVVEEKSLRRNITFTAIAVFDGKTEMEI